MPPLHQRASILPHQLVPVMAIEDPGQGPAQMCRVVKEPPSHDETQGVHGHHPLDARARGEDKEGQKDDLEVGLGSDGAENAQEGADGATGA